MTVWTLIPARAFAGAKQRLAGVLSPDRRASLARTSLERTLSTVRQAVGTAAVVVVVTDDPAVGIVARAAGADNALVSDRPGLNPQLAHAAQAIPPGDDLLVLHADLPLLTVDDIAALLATPGSAVIAPDRHGQGTNALLLRGGARFFHFGPNSAPRHREAAQALGLPLTEVHRPGLSFDLDDPADWNDLPAGLREELAP